MLPCFYKNLQMNVEHPIYKLGAACTLGLIIWKHYSLWILSLSFPSVFVRCLLFKYCTINETAARALESHRSECEFGCRLQICDFQQIMARTVAVSPATWRLQGTVTWVLIWMRLWLEFNFSFIEYLPWAGYFQVHFPSDSHSRTYTR